MTTMKKTNEPVPKNPKMVEVPPPTDQAQQEQIDTLEKRFEELLELLDRHGIHKDGL